MDKKILSILLALMICIITIAPAIAQPTPFLIDGYVFDSNSNPCNDPAVRVTNTNTGESWDAENSSTSNYYRLVLDSGDVSADHILEINASGCSQSKTLTVTEDDINEGGFSAILAEGICCLCCLECGQGEPCEYSPDILTQTECEAEGGLWLAGETDASKCADYHCDGEGNCVPEVATIVLVALGLLGIFGVIWRKREE